VVIISRNLGALEEAIQEVENTAQEIGMIIYININYKCRKTHGPL